MKARNNLPAGCALFAFFLLMPLIFEGRGDPFAHDFINSWSAACRYMNFSTAACSRQWEVFSFHVPDAEISEYVFRIYPPPMLLLLAPYTWLAPGHAYFVFAALSILSALLGFYLYLKNFPAAKTTGRPVTVLIVATFVYGIMPFHYAIKIGQASTFMLLLLVLYLLIERSLRPVWLGGFMLALLAVKPQTLLLFFVYLLRNSGMARIRRELMWMFGFSAVFYAAAFGIQPEVIPSPSAAQLTWALSAKQPNLGSWLEVSTGIRSLRLAPLIAGVLFIFLRGDPFSIPVLLLKIIPLGLLLTPYCALYDMVLLVPALLLITEHSFNAAGRIQTFAMLFIPLLISLGVTLTLAKEEYFVWMPLWFLLMGRCVLRNIENRQS